MLLRTHDWSDEVLERLRSAQRDKRTRLPPKRRHGKRPGYWRQARQLELPSGG